MEGTARGSPKTKGVADLPERIARLERFVDWGQVKRLDLRELAGADQWEAYWARLSVIEKAMADAQADAVLVQGAIRRAMNDGHGISFEPVALDPQGGESE
jgi:hypothetical protein